VSQAGLSFNYAAWTAGTVVTLCTVPWNSDYRDVVRFANQAGLDSYIDTNPGPRIKLNNMTLVVPGQQIRIDLPLNAVYPFNYVRVQNPAQPITGDVPKSFYYFLTNPEYGAPNTTLVNVQLDVWQTFGYGISFGNCYIERGHIGVANESQFFDNGREYLTIPEGLDVGGEYRIMRQWFQNVADARSADPEVGEENYDVMVISSLDLTAAPGTKDDPNIKTAHGSYWENLPNGATVYIFNTFQFAKFLAEFSDKPWITQGIMGISVVPVGGIYTDSGNVVSIGTCQATIPPSRSMNRRKTPLAPNWRDTPDVLPERYARLKKFLTYPYSVLELTSYTGTPLLIKPENWQDPDATVMELPHFAPPNPRLAFYPFRYNAYGASVVTDDMGVVNDGGEFLDMSTGIMNFPTFSIVNDGGIAYLAANANTIAYQHNSADWGQQRAQAGAVNQYNQASNSIRTSGDVNQIGNTASQRQTQQANETMGMNALSGAVFGAINGGPGKGIGALTGAAQQGINYAINSNQNTMSNAISVGASQATNRAQNANAGYARDTNLDYATYANQGDYENAIAGIQAKIQDAALIQPTTSGQVGGDAFLLAVYKWGYDLRWKMLNGAAMRAVGEYWLRYGYQVNQFIGNFPTNFMVMEKFTYWKLRETYIVGAGCPEQFKQAIRGIFEKGVTVWSSPDYIGTIDIADNAPLEGINL